MKELDDDLILTLFVAGDAAVLCEGDGDPELRRRFEFPDDFVPSLTHSLEVIHRWEREREAGERFPFAVRDAATGELLGGCELRPVAPGVANISYWTYPGHRDRGVATGAVALASTFAFSDDRFRTLEALIEPDNTASRRVVARNGFAASGEREGRLLYVRYAP